MLNKEISRKDFLRLMGAFLGLFALSRLPSLGSKTAEPILKDGSYGNGTYGGSKGK